MNGPARWQTTRLAVLVGGGGVLLLLGACSPKGDAAKAAAAPGTAKVADGQACAQICDASAACGDTSNQCLSRCNEWLVKRSRPGIASATAKCAVPRIDDACSEDAAQGAARALVSCVDEAGRSALASDKKTLLVAARAICDRGVRCGGGSPKDASYCVQRIVGAPSTPKGLGIFGAIKPTLVSEFASCLQTSGCGPGGSECFGAMLGETGAHPGEEPDEGDGQQAPPAVPAKPATPPSTGGTKI